MYPNPIFRQASRARNIAFARERAFGTLAINGEDGPITAHVPFFLDDDGAHLEMHLVRSNDIARAALPAKAVLTVSGPDSYISPDWYGIDDQVPTWNYVAVRLRGTLDLAPPETLHPHLDRVSAHMETVLDPKPRWHSEKMTDGVMERMMRAIVPVTMSVTTIDGTWKLGQNKPDDVRIAAANHVRAYGIGQEINTLAGLMLGAKEDQK